MESPSPSPLLRHHVPPSSPPEINLNDLKALKILGKGAMGTVFLVHDVVSDPKATFPFALKVADKAAAAAKHGADRRARWEIWVLKKISSDVNPHPFLPRLIGTLETQDFLAWAFPYCPGGDLNVLRHRQNDGVFSVSVIRFYLAEIITALEKLHSMGIVYRDLKPENILIQSSGHVTLTDFDLSRNLSRVKKHEPDFLHVRSEPGPRPKRLQRKRFHFVRWMSVAEEKRDGLRKAKSARVSPVSRRRPSSFNDGEKSHSFVGTEEYVSPEVVRGDGHEFTVDWWALGVLAYEMMYGKTPFKGKNRKETFRNVLSKEPEFTGNNPTDLTDLIRRLLRKDPTERLGYYQGGSEIKRHVFFKGVKWDLLTEVLRPPFIPSRDDDGELTEKVTAVGGLDIREYFKKLSSPPSLPPSPPWASDPERDVSFMEY